MFRDTLTFLQSLPSQIVRIFDNLSIRAKLFVYGGILIGLIVGLALYALSQVLVITGQQIPSRVAARDMANSLLTMHINDQQLMAEAESPNTEFYIKRESPSFDAWQENYQKLNDNYDKIIKLYAGMEIASTLSPVKKTLEEYQSTFLEIMGALQQRGFQAFGRAGALELRGDALEASLAKRTQAYITILKLRQAQSNFFLHPELKDVSDFDTYANQLEIQLINDEERTVFHEYTTLFHEIVTLYERVGFTATTGLRGELARLIGEASPIVLTTEAQVVELTSRKITAIFQSVFIATIIIVTVGTFLAFSIARLITRRLDQLLKATSRVAAGDFEYRIKNTSSDELGHLANTFDTMAERLHANQKVLRERAHALSQSVRRFELVSRAVREAIYEWDMKTNELDWGDGLVSEFGYSTKDRQAMIEWWTDRIHPDDAEEVNNSLTKHFARQSTTWQAVYRFKKAGGQYVYCQDKGFIEYHHGEPVRMVGSLVDITRQKELDRAKDEFISIASHQLRTPLGSIRWNLDLLREKSSKLPKDIRIDIEEAYGSTLRMLGLVGDLLSVARIEQHRVQYMPQQTDLITIILSAVQEMQPLARQRHISIDTKSFKKHKADVIIDPKRFREVIQNLLSNAVKYTPEHGKVVVTVEVEPKKILVSVSDTGVGIPDEDAHRLFSKFFRASNVTTTDTEGSGLGLFVVKSYVESWGGRIWFKSELNKGTTFYISIPDKIPVQKTTV